MRLRTALLGLGGALLLSGCTFEQALDRMADAERQAAVIADARTLCTNPQSLLPRIDARIRDQSAGLFAQLPGRCPQAGMPYRITGFTFETGTGPDAHQESATIVAGEGDHWTEFTLRYAGANDNALRIVEWNVEGMRTVPESLAGIEAWNSIGWWVQLVGLSALALLGLILLLVGLSKRRRAQAGAGTPPA